MSILDSTTLRHCRDQAASLIRDNHRVREQIVSSSPRSVALTDWNNFTLPEDAESNEIIVSIDAELALRKAPQ